MDEMVCSASRPLRHFATCRALDFTPATHSHVSSCETPARTMWNAVRCHSGIRPLSIATICGDEDSFADAGVPASLSFVGNATSYRSRASADCFASRTFVTGCAARSVPWQPVWTASPIAVVQSWETLSETCNALPAAARFLADRLANLWLGDLHSVKAEDVDRAVDLPTKAGSLDRYQSWIDEVVERERHVKQSLVADYLRVAQRQSTEHVLPHRPGSIVIDNNLLLMSAADNRAIIMDGQHQLAAVQIAVSARNRQRAVERLLSAFNPADLCTVRWNDASFLSLFEAFDRELRGRISIRVRLWISLPRALPCTTRDRVRYYQLRTGCPPPAAVAVRPDAHPFAVVSPGGLHALPYYRSPSERTRPVSRHDRRSAVRLRHRYRCGLHVRRVGAGRGDDVAHSCRS